MAAHRRLLQFSYVIFLLFVAKSKSKYAYYVTVYDVLQELLKLLSKFLNRLIAAILLVFFVKTNCCYAYSKGASHP